MVEPALSEATHCPSYIVAVPGPKMIKNCNRPSSAPVLARDGTTKSVCWARAPEKGRLSFLTSGYMNSIAAKTLSKKGSLIFRGG